MTATIPQPPKRKTRSVRKMAREADTAVDEIGTADPDDLSDLLPEGEQPTMAMSWREPAQLATLEARDITAWFGDHMVLDQVLADHAGRRGDRADRAVRLRQVDVPAHPQPDAPAGPQRLAGRRGAARRGGHLQPVGQRLTQARRDIGMVFQKPNPFPAMSIYDNVVAGLKLTGVKVSRDARDAVVEECLTKAGLWKEVRDRLRQPGGALSGGQQQRLCIARSLAVRPRVLLMDEPCSALDPTSTRVIEETMADLVREVTIVIVTHNMQQAQRVSNQCAFFLAAQGEPGHIVEHGPTDAMFGVAAGSPDRRLRRRPLRLTATLCALAPPGLAAAGGATGRRVTSRRCPPGGRRRRCCPGTRRSSRRTGRRR